MVIVPCSNTARLGWLLCKRRYMKIRQGHGFEFCRRQIFFVRVHSFLINSLIIQQYRQLETRSNRGTYSLRIHTSTYTHTPQPHSSHYWPAITRRCERIYLGVINHYLRREGFLVCQGFAISVVLLFIVNVGWDGWQRRDGVVLWVSKAVQFEQWTRDTHKRTLVTYNVCFKWRYDRRSGNCDLSKWSQQNQRGNLWKND